MIGVFSTKAQDMTLTAGAAWSNMDDLRKTRDFVQSMSPVPLKITADFPAYWRFGFMMRWRIGTKMKLGFLASTTSTGSRATYEDYSGSIRFDQRVNNIGIGPHFQYNFVQDDKNIFAVYLNEGVLFSAYDVDYEIVLLDQSIDDATDYKATDIYSEPGLLYERKIGPRFSLYAGAGYQFSTYGKIDYDGDEEEFAGFEDGDRTDWSGARLNLGATIRLGD